MIRYVIGPQERMRQSALSACRLSGCTCEPDITVTEETPGMYRAGCAHDSWCALAPDTQEKP